MQRVIVKIDPEAAKKLSPQRRAALLSAGRAAGLMLVRMLDAQGLEWDPENGGVRPKRVRRPAKRKQRAPGANTTPPTQERP
ncbi:MAG: hypothetical protein HY369_03650 [Candidatus Aenigmarchaeota archaeon]|nr:hypothetical protein [Candidatus Aenigmarchaeota archaeon]